MLRLFDLIQEGLGFGLSVGIRSAFEEDEREEVFLLGEAVFQRVLQGVPRDQVEKIALQWQQEPLGPVPAPDAVVIDGKEVRGGDVMLVNAIAQPSQQLLGVEAVDKKTNQIPTARTLIQSLDLKAKMVQLDGMHTQHETVHQILYEKGADYPSYHPAQLI